MRVIFDPGLLRKDCYPTTTQFIVDLISRIAELSPYDEFILLSHSGQEWKRPLPTNVKLVPVPAGIAKIFGGRFQERVQMPSMVKRLKADLFVGIDNPHIDSYPQPRINLMLNPFHPQPNDEAWSGPPEAPKVFRIKPGSATQVLSFSKAVLSALNESPLEVILPKPFIPVSENLSWAQRENVKDCYAGGFDYFLFAGDLHPRYQLLDLLKAFSQFKKWQGSGMRLVLAGQDCGLTHAFRAQLEKYRFRDEVILLMNPDETELPGLMQAAYALIYPAAYDNFPINALKAAANGLPVISTQLPVLQEWLNGAILSAEKPLVEGLSQAMQQLFKDESLREELAGKAASMIPVGSLELPEKFLAALREAARP